MADPMKHTIPEHVRQSLRESGYVAVPINPTQEMADRARWSNTGLLSYGLTTPHFVELWFRLLRIADPGADRHIREVEERYAARQAEEMRRSQRKYTR